VLVLYKVLAVMNFVEMLLVLLMLFVIIWLAMDRGTLHEVDIPDPAGFIMPSWTLDEEN
jgi:hypothetical protein